MSSKSLCFSLFKSFSVHFNELPSHLRTDGLLHATEGAKSLGSITESAN